MKRILNTLALIAMVAVVSVNAYGTKAKKMNGNGNGSDYGLAMVKLANKTEHDKTIRVMSGTQLIATYELPSGTKMGVDLATSKMGGIELNAKPDVITIHIRGRDLKPNEMFKLRNEDEIDAERRLIVFDHNGKKTHRLQRDQEELISLSPATILAISIVNTANHKNVVKVTTLSARNFRQKQAGEVDEMPVQAVMQVEPIVKKHNMPYKSHKTATQKLYEGTPTWVQEATEDPDVTTI